MFINHFLDWHQINQFDNRWIVSVIIHTLSGHLMILLILIIHCNQIFEQLGLLIAQNNIQNIYSFEQKYGRDPSHTEQFIRKMQ